MGLPAELSQLVDLLVAVVPNLNCCVHKSDVPKNEEEFYHRGYIGFVVLAFPEGLGSRSYIRSRLVERSACVAIAQRHLKVLFELPVVSFIALQDITAQIIGGVFLILRVKAFAGHIRADSGGYGDGKSGQNGEGNRQKKQQEVNPDELSRDSGRRPTAQKC